MNEIDHAAGRRRWRKECVDKFLASINVSRQVLARPTQRHLDEWARQVQLVTDQPSANWEAAILNICKAVESQLAISFGSITGLDFLAAPTPLGSKAHSLKNAKLDAAVKQKLSSSGIKPGFVASTLSTKLFALAELRSGTGSAHGGGAMWSATARDAREALRIAGDILIGIVPNRGTAQK
jgi:hypothetical protein